MHILLNVFGHNKSFLDLYQFGLLPVHNGFLLAADFLLEFFNSLVSGNSSTDFVKKKIELLFSCEDLPSSFLTNIQNNSKNIGKACIAYLALIIRPEIWIPWFVYSVDAVQKLSIGMVHIGF